MWTGTMEMASMAFAALMGIRASIPCGRPARNIPPSYNSTPPHPVRLAAPQPLPLLLPQLLLLLFSSQSAHNSFKNGTPMDLRKVCCTIAVLTARAGKTLVINNVDAVSTSGMAHIDGMAEDSAIGPIAAKSDTPKPGKPLLRIHQIASTHSGSSTAVFSIQCTTLIAPEDQKDFTVKIHSSTGNTEYSCRDIKFQNDTAFCNVPASWLAGDSVYSFEVSNERGVAKYDVRWKYANGRLVDVYFSAEELNRWLFPLRIVGVYVLCSMLVLCVYEYGRGRSKRYQERMAEVDSMIREIQERAAEEE